MDRNLIVFALIALFVGGGLVTYTHQMTTSLEKVTNDIEASQRGLQKALAEENNI